MNYLIDTHILLWLLFDSDKISKKFSKVLESPDNNVYVSSVSFWEISLKYSIGKLILFGYKPHELVVEVPKMGISISEVDHILMANYHKLALQEQHRDPFDRLIIWQCIVNQFVLVSQDNHFSAYESHGLQLLES